MKTKTKQKIKGREVSIAFAKNCQINGWWLRISLSNDELLAVETQHREYAKQIIQQCLDDAQHIGLKNKKAVILATALFDKRCHKIYTYISNALDEKVKQARNNPCKPPRNTRNNSKEDSSESHPFFRCRICTYQSKMGANEK